MSCLILIMLNKQINVMQSNVNDLISIIFSRKRHKHMETTHAI